MTPPTFGELTSSGERIFFEAVRNTDIRGTCFHSLRLSKHPTKPVSEADFVLLTDRAVIVVEVKSGGVSCGDDGVWRYEGRTGVTTDTAGPVVQAEKAQWALRDRLTELVGPEIVGQFIFGWAAAFPQCEFTAQSVEWEVWQIFDQRHRGKAATGKWIERCVRQWQSKVPPRSAPTPAALRALKQAIRPQFAVVPTLASLADDVLRDCIRLTSSQAERLELVETAPRLVITGGAGTGKTLLALETARTHAGLGQRTVLMATSPAMAAYLSQQPQIEGVEVVTAGQRPNAVPPADVLVVDEGQDVLDFDGLDMISNWIDGGLENGTWRIFLDDNRQAALLERFDPEAYELILANATLCPRLTRNCRNTTQIVDHVEMLTGADIGSPTVTDGAGVTLEMVADRESAAELLEAQLRHLNQQGVPRGDIAVLTPTPDESCIELLSSGLRKHMRRFDQEAAAEIPTDQTIIATPTEFKGFEASFVFVVDVDDLDGSDRAIDELYVALTRARTFLWVALEDHLEDELRSLVRKHLGANP